MDKKYGIEESFKSQKLKKFAKEHGGLKYGSWSADFNNDLYNMTDKDFEDYMVVDQDAHYSRYGLNGWDKESDFGNNNFQPIEFNDGTFMVKRNPELRWDDRAKKMMSKHDDRRKNRRNDGKTEYQYENPYLNKMFNQDDKPRGDWGFIGDNNLDKNNINMKGLRQKSSHDGEGRVIDKAKASRKMNESQFRQFVRECVKRVLMEGIYDYPDTVDYIILMFENDRECYDVYSQMARSLAKNASKGVELSVDMLSNSSWMKHFQQWCFKKFKSEQPDLDSRTSPSVFRQYVAEKMIDEINYGVWNEQPMNEVNVSYYTEIAKLARKQLPPQREENPDNRKYKTAEDNKPMYETSLYADDPYFEEDYLIRSDNDVRYDEYPEGKEGDIEFSWDKDTYDNDITPMRDAYYKGTMSDKYDARQNRRYWTNREIAQGERMMDKWVRGERDEEDIEDAWDDVEHPASLNESIEDWPMVNTESDGDTLYKVSIWCGSGYVLSVFRAWANNGEEALEYVVAYLDKNGDNSLFVDDAVERDTKEMEAEGKDEEEIWNEIDKWAFYVDATMEGASEPHYLYLENLGVVEFPEEYMERGRNTVGDELNEGWVNEPVMSIKSIFGKVVKDFPSKEMVLHSMRRNLSSTPYEFFSDYIKDYFPVTLKQCDSVCDMLKEYYGFDKFYATDEGSLDEEIELDGVKQTSPEDFKDDETFEDSIEEKYGYQNVPDAFVKQVGENGYEVYVPDYCLPYLVNGDTEGYSEEEIGLMNKWIEDYMGKLRNGLNAGDCCIPMDGEEPSFRTCNDIFGNKGGDCYRFFLPAK